MTTFLITPSLVTSTHLIINHPYACSSHRKKKSPKTLITARDRRPKSRREHFRAARIVKFATSFARTERNQNIDLRLSRTLQNRFRFAFNQTAILNFASKQTRLACWSRRGLHKRFGSELGDKRHDGKPVGARSSSSSSTFYKISSFRQQQRYVKGTRRSLYRFLFSSFGRCFSRVCCSFPTFFPLVLLSISGYSGTS